MGAGVEVEAGASEETSQGNSGVSAKGTTPILEYNLTPRIFNQQKQKGAEGVGKPRGKQGYDQSNIGKQQWDPGSRKESRD